jgi:hypothetical protein
MPLLQVRDFPNDVYEELSFEARARNRTIAQQTIVLIKKGLNEPMSGKERRRLISESIRSMKPPGALGEIETVSVIREMREERTEQILRSIEGAE